MRTFAYRLCTHFDDHDFEFATNNISDVMEQFEINYIGGMYTEVVSGITGEVLTYVNSPEEENYFSDEFKLIYKGWQFERIEKSLE